MEFEKLEEFENINTYQSECSFLSKVDKAISGYYNIEIINHVSEEDSEIGFTDIKEKKIWINFKEINNKSDSLTKFVALFKGINYHELGHIMYTNISKNNLYVHLCRLKKLNKNKSKNDFDIWLSKAETMLNILEDIKIENYFTTRFIKSKDYFCLLIDNFIVNNKEVSPEIFLLIYGRKSFYLNKNIISNFEILFKKKYGSQITEKAKEICDKYISASNIKEQSELIFELAEIIEYDKNQLPTAENKNNITGKHQLKKNQKLISVAVDNNNNQKEKLKNNTQLIMSNENVSDLISNIEEDIKIEQLKEQVKENIDLIENNIQEDIDKDIKTLYNKKNMYKGADLSENLEKHSKNFNPTENSILNSKKLERLLKVLNTDLKSSNKRFQKSGRIDVKSILKAKHTGSCRLFRKFKADTRDQTKLAVSILLDGSGSVDYTAWEKQIEASWIITTALEKLQNKVMLIEFSNNWKLKKGFYTKANWQRYFNGGTEPYNAIEYSLKCFKSIQYKENIYNHVLIILTDGAWFHENENDQLIDKVNSYGIYTVLINCSNYKGSNHNCQEVINIDDMNKLPLELKDIIKRIKIRLVKKIR